MMNAELPPVSSYMSPVGGLRREAGGRGTSHRLQITNTSVSVETVFLT